MSTAKINPDLRKLARPIAELHEDPRNARKHAERDLATIATSLSTHGQQKPIVVTKAGKVIAGNGTLAAARSLGWDRIAVVTYDDEDAAKAAAFALVDNRSAELSEWDNAVLGELLTELSLNSAIDMEATGFTSKEVEALLAGWKGEDAVDPASIAEYNSNTETFVVKIEGIAPSAKDDVVAKIAKALEGTGLLIKVY